MSTGCSKYKIQNEMKKKVAQTTRDKALSHIDDALDALHKIAMDSGAPASARVSACKELLDRAEGKPRQQIEKTINDGDFEKFNYIVNQLRLELGDA